MTVVRQLLTSKKFIAVLAGIVVWLGAYAGLEIDPLSLSPIFGLLISYILGQGIADHGKGAEQERTRREERDAARIRIGGPPAGGAS